MKVTRTIATILVFVSMAFILACGAEKTASLEGNEDIVAVLEKIPECMDNTETAMEIYTDDAILMYQDPTTMNMVELIGPKEIGLYRRETGKHRSIIRVSINNIIREADTAHVKFKITTQDPQNPGLEWDYNCSAEMVKKGQTWRIKKETVEQV